ncbi:hypothetical protein [Methylobacterium dankookense]|uniref:Major cell-surface adhesin PAc n=1 Tax=Methylobacterium dankookense TaxID=560405 RepID=A0A564FV67_9HYPH|nr:hypothetical protein [Methylobacterium dankookense]GJD56738.1 hypothetical protein IFDJLNFL_2635 [Methylobacterium dankookense]VUF11754.1 Major cell-surface adhesin PAc [Methylobacterium dankookense]
MLAGSLHAAIVACAYDVPFGYLDTGFVDIPFKWRDFSALVGIGTSFCDCVADARAIYEQVNRPRLRKPPLLPMLAVAPFSVRLEMLLKAYHYDMQNLGRASAPYGAHLTAVLGRRDYTLLEPDPKPPEAPQDPVAPAEDPLPEPSPAPDEPRTSEEETPPEQEVAPSAAEPEAAAPPPEAAEQAPEQPAHPPETQDPLSEAEPETAHPIQPEAPMEAPAEPERPDPEPAPEDEASTAGEPARPTSPRPDTAG